MTAKKPPDPLTGRGFKKEPWEAGPWCARCGWPLVERPAAEPGE